MGGKEPRWVLTVGTCSASQNSDPHSVVCLWLLQCWEQNLESLMCEASAVLSRTSALFLIWRLCLPKLPRLDSQCNFPEQLRLQV